LNIRRAWVLGAIVAVGLAATVAWRLRADRPGPSKTGPTTWGPEDEPGMESRAGAPKPNASAKPAPEPERVLANDWKKPIRDLHARLRRLKTPAERLDLLLKIVDEKPADPEARRRRAYAVRLLGVVAAESEEIARRIFPRILLIARTDEDPCARALAIGAVAGFRVPEYATDNPNVFAYLDPKNDGQPPAPFDRAFPEWARTSPEYAALLQELSGSGQDPTVRRAAIRGRALLADEGAVADLAALVVNPGEPADLRVFASKVLYRSASPRVWPVVNDLALGLIPGLPPGYQTEALRALGREGRVDERHEARLTALVCDGTYKPEDRRAALEVAGDLDAQKKWPAARKIVLSALGDASPDLRVRSLELLRRTGDPALIGPLETALAAEKDPVVVEHLRAALYQLDPSGNRRPSLVTRIEEIEKLLEDPTGDPARRKTLQADAERLNEQWKALEASRK
jgi:hypothetical protein